MFSTAADVVVIGISIDQEHQIEHALAALRDLSAPRALVIRDGRQLRILACRGTEDVRPYEHRLGCRIIGS